jgi:hypothetical protein
MDATTIAAIIAVVVFMCGMGGLILYAHTPPKNGDGAEAKEDAKAGKRRRS